MLETTGLSVRYPGTPDVVRGLDLAVPDDSTFALVGANGAGKTTTLKAVAGLLRPSAGRVVFDGRDITRMPSHRRVRAGLVLVPEGRAVQARMSVRDNLAIAGTDRTGVLDRFPILTQRWHAPAGTLSGGEQQMLAIARGLLLRPRVLLLDEPTLGLSPLMATQVFDLIGQIRADGTTVVVVEQNARRALAVADRAAVLETGRLAVTGTGQDLLADESVAAAYLGGGATRPLATSPA
ncbi:ABC transporter ATP-binding protein [Streptacidiphilus rugosus]|uniref:ABC transporter ATP-binding protein n=1 Tax=Streptacidiphilus rugosus TaxID=405783 RepID=UPI000B09114B|nr:ABC transporter ATP-binding protein [Streptacidiphilus rugosus]